MTNSNLALLTTKRIILHLKLLYVFHYQTVSHSSRIKTKSVTDFNRLLELSNLFVFAFTEDLQYPIVLQSKMTPKQTATRRSLRIALRGNAKLIFKLMQLLMETLLTDNRFRNDDFISTCPYEILCTIVRHVPLIDLDECLLVCRRWRALLLECPVPWQTFKMEPMCFIGNASYMDSPALSLLPSVCKHIEVLDFQDFHDTYVKTMSVFLTHDFPKLRSLHINDQGT